MFSAAAVAFLVAALLILLVFRLAFGRRLRMAGGRTRQPRLGIVDAFDVDRQRQLVIVRRDNTEHLVMIGGPNDLLIESSIVRAEVAREPLRRDKDVEPKLAASPDPAAPPMSLEDAIGAALAAPPLPATTGGDGMSASPPAAPRAPVLPLPTRRPPPPAAGVARPGLPSAAPPVLSASPPTGGAAPPIGAPPPVAGLRRPIPPLGGASDAPASPRPPLLRVPPLRPAPRPTPLAPSSSPPPGPTAPTPAAAPAGASPEPSLSGPMPAASAPTPDPKPEPPAAGPADTFESLEEEMAKLLGRGGPGGA